MRREPAWAARALIARFAQRGSGPKDHCRVTGPSFDVALTACRAHALTIHQARTSTILLAYAVVGSTSAGTAGEHEQVGNDRQGMGERLALKWA
jgi:hypothetical protein